MGPPKTKRPKRKDSSDVDDDSEESERMPYFVPEEGIDIEPLALYARGLLDKKAKVKIGSHPQRPDQKGFWIISSIAVTREDIVAMIEDSRLWAKEDSGSHYVNSETAARRMRTGRAQAAKERPIIQAKPHRERSYDESQTPVPQPLSRVSSENINQSNRHHQKPGAIARPATVSGTALDGRDLRKPPTTRHNSQGYVSAPTSTRAHATFNDDFDQEPNPPPPPYSEETKRGGGGSQPSTTGTQGFSRYTTAGAPDQQKPASRHR